MVGSPREKSARSVFPGGAAGGSRHRGLLVLLPGPVRHSTKKRSSTTSRTAKRTAMAHHWRRSARQDTRVSSQDRTFPEMQSH